MKTRMLGCLLAANSLSEIAALGVTAQRAALQNLGLADANGALTFVAWGPNQNITLTPSGTGVTIAQFAAMKAVLSETVAANGYLHFLPTAASATSTNFTVQGTGTDTILNATSTVRFSISASEAGRFQSGNLLLGTPTDSGNGKLQLVTHTTIAGGIGWGSDWAQYRVSATTMEMVSGNATDAKLQIRATTGSAIVLQASGGSAYLDAPVGGGIFCRTNGTTTALTLDSAQRTIFAGLVGFTGVTSSDPALKKSGVTLQVRLGDDSNFTHIRTDRHYLFYGSFIEDTADGVIRLTNNLGTDFGRVVFGGTTNGFPAIQRLGSLVGITTANGSAMTAPTVTGPGLLIGNVTAAPSTNPVGGGVLYCEAGALKFRGTGGTITTLAAA